MLQKDSVLVDARECTLLAVMAGRFAPESEGTSLVLTRVEEIIGCAGKMLHLLRKERSAGLTRKEQARFATMLEQITVLAGKVGAKGTVLEPEGIRLLFPEGQVTLREEVP